MFVRASRDFGGVLVSTDDWPVVLMEFPEQRVTDESLQGSLRFIEELLNDARESGEKSYQVTELSRVHKLPPESQRRYATEWVGRTLALHQTASLGGVSVTPSVILRGLVAVINWWQDADRPTAFVATRREAYVAAIKAFDQAQIPLRPELRGRLLGKGSIPAGASAGAAGSQRP